LHLRYAEFEEIAMSAATLTPPPAAPPIPQIASEPFPWKWTRDQVIQIYDLGMFHGQRVMLIDGEVLTMSPMKSEHANGIVFAMQQLQLLFGSNFTVRPQLPLDLGKSTDPEPDIAVVAGPPRSHPNTPDTAVLVLEVSDTTLKFDLGDKASLYAAAGIADYWVLDVIGKQLHRHRDPRRDAKRRFGYSYRDVKLLPATDQISPLAMPGGSLLVADLLP